MCNPKGVDQDLVYCDQPSSWPYSRPKHDVSDTSFSLLNSYDTYPLPDFRNLDSVCNINTILKLINNS